MFLYQHQVRVRYAETDNMGYVYYGNYATYYEVARTEMLRSTGISYKELEEMGVMLPVIELTCKFKKAAKYDDLVTINTYIREKPGVRIKFEYELFNESGDLLNTSSKKVVFVDMEKGRPCSLPQSFIDKMAPFFGE